MKRIVLSALALAAMTTAAAAEPKKMTEAQMEEVTAGLQFDVAPVRPFNAVFGNEATSAAIGLLSQNVTADTSANTQINENIGVDQSVSPINAVLGNEATSAAIGLLSQNVMADASADTQINENIGVNQSGN